MAGSDEADEGGLLTEAMQELYAGDPDDFMAARKRLVAAAKPQDAAAAKEIGALRKPTLAAWAVNAALRADPALAQRVAEVGQQLRSAQAALDMPRMQALRPDRDALIGDVLAGCAEVADEAGRSLSPSVRETLSATVVAALASQDATAAVVSGALTRALSYSGFGEVDLAEAVVRTSSGAILTVLPGSGYADPAGPAGGATGGDGAEDDAEEDADDEDAEDQADDDAFALAERAHAEAEQRVADAKAAVKALRDRSGALREQIAEAEGVLRGLRAQDEEVLDELATAVAERKAADAARAEATRALARARRG